MENKLAIAWIDLKIIRYTPIKSLISKTECKTTILNELSGCLEFETITALMGSKGTGKTTLLKCLSGALDIDLAPGSKIYLNCGKKIRTCFISHDMNEHLLPRLKVLEAVVYASKLKNSEFKNDVEHRNNARYVMRELKISQKANILCDYCTEDQRKRIAIALELTAINKPHIVLIDELSTGLNIDAAENLAEILKGLSRKHHMAIMTSIHQANNSLISTYDQLYILAKGAINIYCGAPCDLNKTFGECGINYNEFQYSIDFMLKLSGKGLIDDRVTKLKNKFHQLNESLRERCSDESYECRNRVYIKPKIFQFIDFWYLLLRTCSQNYLGDWKSHIILLTCSLTYALILGAIFGDEIGEVQDCVPLNGSWDQRSCAIVAKEHNLMINHNFFQMYATKFFMMFQLIITCLMISADLQVFFRQHRNRWYSTGCFFIVNTIVETLPLALISMAYCGTVYHITGQSSEFERFIKYYLSLTLGMLCTQSLKSLFNIIFHKNYILVLIFASGIYAFYMIFAGFFTPLKLASDFVEFLSDLSVCKYVYYSVMLALFGFNRCPAYYIPKKLDELDINDDDDYWRYVIFSIANYTAMKLLAFIALVCIANDITIQALLHKWNVKRLYPRYYPRLESPIELYRTVPRLNEDSHYRVGFPLTENSRVRSDSGIFEQVYPKYIILAWVTLSIDIGNKWLRQEKYLIKDVWGHFEFGSLNAVLGPRGVGKTALLRSLSARCNECLSYETKIYLNSKERIRSCFISQDMSEHLNKDLTVRQNLLFASKLKNSNCAVSIDHNSNVNHIMDVLFISDIADKTMNKCTRAQFISIIIGAELTATIKPNIIFIDELTSGMDNETAQIILSSLKIISRKYDMAIVTSLNYSSKELITMFDNLYVLARNGINVYSGSPYDLYAYLSEADIIVRDFETPIEVLLKLSVKDITEPSVHALHSKASQHRQELIDRCRDERALYSHGIQIRGKRFNPMDVWYLLCRYTQIYFRYHWMAVLLELGLYQALCAILTIIQEDEIDEPDGCVNPILAAKFGIDCHHMPAHLRKAKFMVGRNAIFLFAMVFSINLLHSAITVLLFPMDLKIIFNEHRNGWYNINAYYIARSIMDFVRAVIIILIFAKVMDLYNEAHIYWGYVLVLFTGVMAIQSINHFLGALFHDHPKIALALSVVYLLFAGLLCNLSIQVRELDAFFESLSNVSLTRLMLENLLIIIYGFDRCDRHSYSAILKKLDIDENYNYPKNFICMVLLIICFRVLTIICLHIKANLYSPWSLFRAFKTGQFRSNNSGANRDSIELVHSTYIHYENVNSNSLDQIVMSTRL